MADASIKTSLLSRIWAWRNPPADPPAGQAPTSESAPPMVTVIEGVRYVFGLEWRLIPPTRSLQRTLSLACTKSFWCSLSDTASVKSSLTL